VLDATRTALATGEVPAGPPKLRPLQERLRAAVPDGVDANTAGAVIEASDRVTNSLDTLLAELRRQLAPAGPTDPA